MNLLQIIWIASLVLLAVSVGSWLALVGLNALTTRSQRRQKRYQDEWLDRLIEWMEGENEEDRLPRARNTEEMEAVLSHIRDLAENFRGHYRERLALALKQVGAHSYALKLLHSRWPFQRANAAAILNWCSLNRRMIQELRWALEDEDPMVRLEAALTLVHAGELKDPDHVIECLCRDEAAESLVARDVFRTWAESGEMNLERLLKKEWSPRAWVLLLEAAGSASLPHLTPWIAAKANDSCPEVAIAALQALEECADPEAEQTVLSACTHSEQKVRMQAVQTLRACGTLKGGQSMLLKLLKDETFEVRKAVVSVLMDMGGEDMLRSQQPWDYWTEQLCLEAGVAPMEA